MRAIEDYLLSLEVGALPYAGAMQEQPHTVTIFYRLLRTAAAEANKAEMDEAKAK
jgi:hypothetical protein